MSDDNESDVDDPDQANEVTRERAGRLDEKERRLESQEREINAREQELDERDQNLLERRENLLELSEQLENRETQLENREETIENREVALNERERELDDRTTELDRREETLEAYVGDQLSDLESSLSETVQDSVNSAIDSLDMGETGGHIGTIGNLLLALVGLVLVVGGVANLFATETAVIPTLFNRSAANFGASAVLIFSGLAANLAAAAGRL